MKKNVFIGIDVSKHTLDTAFITRDGDSLSDPVWRQFSNTPSGLKEMKKWLHQMNVSLDQQAIIVIENTGIYHRLLWQYFSGIEVDLCIENAAQVKWSLGIARGKNDKVDSRRLALYAVRHADRLKPTPRLHNNIMALKDLLTLRTKLITQSRSISTGFNELKNVSEAAIMKTMQKLLRPAQDGLKESIKKAEAQIKTMLSQDKELSKIYKLLITIPGIGHITAVMLMCCTNMFTLCSSGKQLACYCGVVPFNHQSGISIKGKSRVHRMANKELKRLLHLCALTVIRHKQEFKLYYERKKQEGKHAMSILNAIRNKIILRVFAVVKNDRPYVNNCIQAV
jgi:transposase